MRTRRCLSGVRFPSDFRSRLSLCTSPVVHRDRQYRQSRETRLLTRVKKLAKPDCSYSPILHCANLMLPILYIGKKYTNIVVPPIPRTRYLGAPCRARSEDCCGGGQLVLIAQASHATLFQIVQCPRLISLCYQRAVYLPLLWLVISRSDSPPSTCNRICGPPPYIAIGMLQFSNRSRQGFHIPIINRVGYPACEYSLNWRRASFIFRRTGVPNEDLPSGGPVSDIEIVCDSISISN